MTKKHQPSIITQLRALVPNRVILKSEALYLAERQAGRFLDLSGITEPPVPEQIVGDLPRFKVGHNSNIPMSGFSQWIDGHWLLVVNSSESFTRQRFTLMHELKHAIDHPITSHGYRYFSKAFIEQICDTFAANVLMPRAWVKSAFCNDGIQDPVRLARHFGVSQAAMRFRLLNLGLVEEIPRCAPYRREPLAEVFTQYEFFGGVA